MEIYLDATNAIFGRIASYAAKQSLLGNSVTILNCEKAIISGSPKNIFDKYHHLIRETGQPRKGPFIPRTPELFFKRMMRGMLPHKRTRGREAHKRIMCYTGIPDKFKDKKLQTIPFADSSKLKTTKYITIAELCKMLGGRL